MNYSVPPAASPARPTPSPALRGFAADEKIITRLKHACEAEGLSYPATADSHSEYTWHFETLDGRLPFDYDVLINVWNRAPYTLRIFLVERSSATERKRVLKQARVGTRGQLGVLRDKVVSAVEVLLCQALRGLYEDGVEDHGTQSLQRASRTRLATFYDYSTGYARYVALRLKASFYREQWSIGVTGDTVEAIVASGSVGAVSWLPLPENVDILADPFWCPGQDVFCEELQPNKPGTIIALSASGGTLIRKGVVMDGPGHLSYPCTFKDQGAVYVVPESIEGDATRVWRVLENNTLVEAAVVAPGVKLADPTLFSWKGKFWIAATRIDIGLHDNLCLYHADSVIGPWTAHRGNPVKIDIVSARPAGSPFLSVAGRLIRPAQDCAASYGAAITLNEVEELTIDTFRERVIGRLTPDLDGPFPDGLHTLSAYGDHSLIDGKRFVLRPYDPLWRLTRRIFHYFARAAKVSSPPMTVRS